MWKNWLHWIFFNTTSLTISFTIIGVIGAQKEIPHRFGNSAPNILGCVVVSIVLGIAQWLVLKNKTSRIRKVWIVTNIIGLPTGAALSFALRLLFIISRFDSPSSFSLDVVEGIQSGMIGGIVGGTIIGIAQYLVWQNWWVWIPTNTIAWAVAWASALPAVRGTDRFIYIFLKITPILPIQLAILGFVLGLVSSVITGGVLAWLLQRSNLQR